MYHISDLKKFIRCKRLYLLSKNADNDYKPYLRQDESITDLLIKYFKIEKYYLGQRNDPGDRVFAYKDEYEWFVRPRFEDKQLRINVPLVHKINEMYDLYFFYGNTSISQLDSITYTVSYNMMNKLGFVVNDIYVIYLNGDYVRNEELDLEELFIVSDRYKGKKIIDIIKNNDFDYEETIDEMSKVSLDNIEINKNKYCKLNGLCDYYDDCFKDIDKDDDSILSLVSSKYKEQMYEEGIRHLKDVDLTRLEGNRTQYAQIMASRNNGLFVDRIALKNWLDKLNDRPISFIDFEWDRYLVPPYKDMKPMDVVCFEFALYYIDEDAHLQHRTFVGTKDCRKEFVEALISNIPSNGPLLAYNASGAECLRIKELAHIYPEYADKLNDINSRLVDLAVPFVDGIIYDTRMQGNYTLKKLVDICSDYSYKDLEIYNGMDAVFNWRNVDKGTQEENIKIINNLKQYCSLDAYGLFLVYKWLIEVILNKKGD